LKIYDISNTKVVSDNSTDQQYAFQVYKHAKAWQFAATNTTEKEDWIDWIRQTAESYTEEKPLKQSADEKRLSRSSLVIGEEKQISRPPSTISVGRSRGSTTEDMSDSSAEVQVNISLF
jgi:hypothetical protein